MYGPEPAVWAWDRCTAEITQRGRVILSLSLRSHPLSHEAREQPLSVASLTSGRPKRSPCGRLHAHWRLPMMKVAANATRAIAAPMATCQRPAMLPVGN